MSGTTDTARLIISSLFPTSNPSRYWISISSKQTTFFLISIIFKLLFLDGESYIAHVQTFEEVPGSSQKKPRFLILACKFVWSSR